MYGSVPSGGPLPAAAGWDSEHHRLLPGHPLPALQRHLASMGLLGSGDRLTARGLAALGSSLAVAVLSLTGLVFQSDSSVATARPPPTTTGPPPLSSRLPPPPILKPAVKCPAGQIDILGDCHERSEFLTDPGDRVFAFENHAGFTVWMAGIGPPLFKPKANVTGFRLDPGKSFVVALPSDLAFFRFWPRTGCRNLLEVISLDGQDVNITKLHCQTGDCGSLLNNFGLECLSTAGLPPASLVQFQLSPKMNDFYDLSNVDGYNVGIKVEPYNSEPYGPNHTRTPLDCGSPACVMDTSRCPEELKWVDADGLVHCLSVCQAISSERQRAEHEVLQDLYDATTDRGLMRDFLCCQCGDSKATCESLSLKCTYGCSPFTDSYGSDASYNTRKCDRINGSYLPAWPSATNGDNYAAVFDKQCPHSYNWQFNAYQNTYRCRRPDYKITILSA